MTAKACRGMNPLRRFTNGDFFQTFNQPWAVSPTGISCHRVPGFIPPMAQFVHNNINSKEVCQVFVLRRQSTSILPVLSRSIESPVTYNLYNHSGHIHTFMHSCIHTSILSCIHTFKRTQRTRTYTISIHTQLHQLPRVSFGRIPSV